MIFLAESDIGPLIGSESVHYLAFAAATMAFAVVVGLHTVLRGAIQGRLGFTGAACVIVGSYIGVARVYATSHLLTVVGGHYPSTYHAIEKHASYLNEGYLGVLAALEPLAMLAGFGLLGMAAIVRQSNALVGGLWLGAALFSGPFAIILPPAVVVGGLCAGAALTISGRSMLER